MRIATLFVLCLALTACSSKKKQPDQGSGSDKGSSSMGSSSMGSSGSDTGSGSGSGSAASGSAQGSDAGSAAAGSGSGAGSGSAGEAMAHQAGNCPSTVFGSTTKAEVKGKDVVLTITSDDKDAIASIQKRSEELLKEKADGKTGPAHDQKGTHGGSSGICPVYWAEGGKAKAKKDAKGSILTITPKEKPEELKKLIDERITKAADWVKANIKPGDQGNKGGVGGGKGGDGSVHAGSGDGKGKERKGTGSGSGSGGGGGSGGGSGGGGGKGTGGGSGGGKGSAAKGTGKGSAKEGGW